MKEDQHTIGAWADQTFGPGTVKGRSLRLLAEVVELCHAAGASPDDIWVAYQDADDAIRAKGVTAWLTPNPDPAAVPGELADCLIVLRTVAHTAGVDLEAEEVVKMHINRYEREWDRTGDGCGQHVEQGPPPAA